MPFCCCVPNCKGNYSNGPRVAVFSFPKDPTLKQKWIQAIKRDNFIPNNSSRVCELHFDEAMVERKTTFKNERTGELLEAPLFRPRLAVGAVPSKLPGCPSYLSKPDLPVRLSPETKRFKAESRDIERAISESLSASVDYSTKISFSSVDEAFQKLNPLSSHLEDSWIMGRRKAKLHFVYLNDQEGGDIYVSKVIVNMSEELIVSVFFGDNQVSKIVCDDKSVFNLPVKVSDTNTLIKLLCSTKNYLLKPCEGDSDNKNKLSLVADILRSVSNQSDKKKIAFEFLEEQLNLLGTENDNRLRYSWETLLFACLLHSVSPHAYKFLRTSNKIVLPSPRTIRTICANFNANPHTKQSGSDFLKYASNKFNLLEDADKTVVLMLDEIHIKPNMDYKGGNIVGGSHASTERATSAHVFMVNSLCSPYKDVVHILPAHTLTGEDLHKITRKVIVGLEKIGFEVIAVVTDNNALNKKAMSFFMETPEVLNEYPHPCDPNRPLFYIIDTVHIIKNIRNNWINKKNNQMFKFPDFEDKNFFRIASFDALKEMHTKEKQQLLKHGYTLTLQALYPSSIERQNVRLALQVFNEHTIAALNELGPKLSLTNYEDTARGAQMG